MKHKPTRPNPKKDKSARRKRPKMSLATHRVELREVMRLSPDGRTRYNIKKRIVKI